jgi:hypothetical protein
MSTSRFLVHHRALSAYSTRTPTERKALDRAINRLVGVPEERWPAAGAVRLESPEPLYLVRVDNSLRAFVRPAAGGQPELVDLVRREMLERFFKNGPLEGERGE